MSLHRLFIFAVLSNYAIRAQSGPVEPGAGAWRTWVVPSVSTLRLPAPPADAGDELEMVAALMAAVDDTDRANIAYWDAGSPGYRWTQLAAQQMLAQNVAPTLFTRGMALVSIAIYDSTIAAWDSKYAYVRMHPSETDPAITPLVAVPNSPSYPSEHAVAAGAASVVLSYLFPAQADSFAAMAATAAGSRVIAGAAYPSDADQGLALGQAIGNMVVAYAQQDGSATPFTGSFPVTAGVWSSANPVTPLAGSWKTWTLSSGSQYRLPAPPAFGSADANALYAAVKNLAQTNSTNHSAWFWQPSFATPWLGEVDRKIFEYHLDQNPPRAARAYALETVAQYDATVACWDSKYTYLELRPSQADPTITPLFANPQHPGYPSGHACASGASSALMQYLFPNDATAISAMATDAGTSTFDAEIHTMFDVSQGFLLGGEVGQSVVGWAQNDGSQPPASANRASSGSRPLSTLRP